MCRRSWDQGFAFDGAGGSVGLGNWFKPPDFHDRLLGEPRDHPAAIRRHHRQQPHRLSLVGRSARVSTETNRYIFAAALPGATAAVPDLPFTLAPNRWTHVVIVRDGATRVATVYLKRHGAAERDRWRRHHVRRHREPAPRVSPLAWAQLVGETRRGEDLQSSALRQGKYLRLENPDGPVSWWRAEGQRGRCHRQQRWGRRRRRNLCVRCVGSRVQPERGRRLHQRARRVGSPPHHGTHAGSLGLPDRHHHRPAHPLHGRFGAFALRSRLLFAAGRSGPRVTYQRRPAHGERRHPRKPTAGTW